MDYYEESLRIHGKYKGKLSVESKFPVTNKDELSIAYTPGVAEPCRMIARNPEDVYKYTIKGNSVAVITDGSAVLGLGNIGAAASLPVMEGKCVLFKRFAGIDAFPIALDTQNVDEIVKTVKLIAPIFGGINLEDISAPRCFEIESRLKNELDIPVMHDDQHGTAVVVLAGLINALKVANKTKDAKVVVSGAGAAGVAITKLLSQYGFSNIIVCDSKGIIAPSRNNLTAVKRELLGLTNKTGMVGALADALRDADIFIGVSAPKIVSVSMIKSMNHPIIFAMANPTPEITPDEAKEGGAIIIGSGRSDFPNQVNNVLAFPGIFKGALSARKRITDNMLLAAAEALAAMVENPLPEKVLPSPFAEGVADVIAEAVKKA